MAKKVNTKSAIKALYELISGIGEDQIAEIIVSIKKPTEADNGEEN